MATLLALSGPEITYSAASARFWCTDNGSMFGGGTSETGTQITIRTAGVFWEASFRVTQNVFSGSTLQFRKNGANGNEAMSVGATATGEFVDPINNDLVVAGDKVCWQLTSTGTGSITVNATSQAYGANTNTVGRLVACSNGNNFTTASTTVYPHLDGQMGTNATATNAELQVPAAATTKNLFVNVTANARTVSTVGSVKNGVTGALTASITATTAGTFEDPTHSDTLAANDLLGVFLTTGTGTATLTITIVSLEVVTTTGNGVVGGSHNSTTFNFGTTTYTEYGATVAGDAVESACQQRVPYKATLSLLWIRASANTVNGTTTYTFRKNGAAGNETVSLAASTSGTASDPTNTDAVSIGNEINFQIVTAGTSGVLTMQGFSQLAASGASAVTADGLAKASDQNAITALLPVAAAGAAKASDQNAATALLVVAATGAARASGTASATEKQAGAATGAAKATGAATAVSVLGITGLKPPLVGPCDMGGYPFVAGAYPWGGASGVSPYTTDVGSGDYSAAVLNTDIVVWWKDLQPNFAGQPIDLTTVPTVTYIGGQSEIATIVGTGINAAQALADALAAGRGVHFRVLGGYGAPQWVRDLPCTDRNGVKAGNRSGVLISGNLNTGTGLYKSIPPFWAAASETWDPNKPYSGFTGAYWGLVSQLAPWLDAHPSVRAVTFAGSLTQDTAEPLVRSNDTLQVANAWWFGWGESTAGAGDDTDTPAVEALMRLHLLAFRYTPMSFSLGPNRRPNVQAIVPDMTSGTTNAVTSPGGHFTAAMDGCLVAFDPARAATSLTAAGGAFFKYTSATTGTLVQSDLVTAFNMTAGTGHMGVFNASPTTSDTAIAQTIGAWAQGLWGRMFLPGTTSFQANDYWLGNNVHTSWLMASGYPWWAQGVVTGNLQNEVQRLGWSNDGFATTVGIPTLTGNIKLSYAGQQSNNISMAGGTAAALATAINNEIATGPLTTLKAEGAVAAASGTHFVTISWPAPPAERADTLIVMDSTAVVGAAAGRVDVTQYEDTLVLDLAAAKLAGAAWFEMHRGYESGSQPAATPAEIVATWPARVDSWQGAPGPGGAKASGTAGATAVTVLQAAGGAKASGTASVTAVLAAQAVGQARATGTATQGALLAGVAAGAAVAAATAAAAALLAGVAAGAAIGSGQAADSALLAVLAAGQAKAAGAAVLALPVSASGAAIGSGQAAAIETQAAAAAGQAVASGAAAGTAIQPAAATGQAVVAGQAAGTAIQPVAATGQAVASGQAAVVLIAPVAAAGQAVASGQAAGTALLGVAAAGTARASGQAGGAALLAVLAAGQALAAGTAIQTAIQPVAAAGRALAAGTAAATAGQPVAADGTARATGQAAIAALLSVAAAGQAKTLGFASINPTFTVSADGTAVAAGAAGAAALMAAVGDGKAISTGQAAALALLLLQAAGQAIAAGQAAQTALQPLAADGQARAQGAAGAAAVQPVAADGQAVASGQAAGTGRQVAAADGQAVASGQANIFATLGVAAAGFATVSGQAPPLIILAVAANGAAVVTGSTGGLYLVTHAVLTVELTSPYVTVPLSADTLTVDLADRNLTVPLGTGP